MFCRLSPSGPNEKTLFGTFPTRSVLCDYFGWALPGSAKRRFDEIRPKQFRSRFFDFPHRGQRKKHPLERFLRGRLHATILGGHFHLAPKGGLTKILKNSSNRVFSTFPLGAKLKNTLWNVSYEVGFPHT